MNRETKVFDDYAQATKVYAERNEMSLVEAALVFASMSLYTLTEQVKWWADASQTSGKRAAERLDKMQASIDRLTDEGEGWQDGSA